MKTNTVPSIQTKNAFFFSHDSNARNDEKILRLRMQHGVEGYGVYFMLIEMLLESTVYSLATNYLTLAFSMRTSDAVVQSVVEDFELFEVDEIEQIFFSPSLSKRMKPLEDLREQRRQAGIRSGEVRRDKLNKKNQSVASQEAIVSEKLNARCQKTNREEKIRLEQTKVEQSRAIGENKIFVAPTLDEVEDYCKKRNNKVDIQRFIDFYQSKGWMVGSNKMKDWQAAVRTWERDLTRKLPSPRAPNITNCTNERQYEKF